MVFDPCTDRRRRGRSGRTGAAARPPVRGIGLRVAHVALAWAAGGATPIAPFRRNRATRRGFTAPHGVSPRNSGTARSSGGGRLLKPPVRGGRAAREPTPSRG